MRCCSGLWLVCNCCQCCDLTSTCLDSFDFNTVLQLTQQIPLAIKQEYKYADNDKTTVNLQKRTMQHLQYNRNRCYGQQNEHVLILNNNSTIIITNSIMIMIFTTIIIVIVIIIVVVIVVPSPKQASPLHILIILFSVNINSLRSPLPPYLFPPLLSPLPPSRQPQLPVCLPPSPCTSP